MEKKLLYFLVVWQCLAGAAYPADNPVERADQTAERFFNVLPKNFADVDRVNLVYEAKASYGLNFNIKVCLEMEKVSGYACTLGESKNPGKYAGF